MKTKGKERTRLPGKVNDCRLQEGANKPNEQGNSLSSSLAVRPCISHASFLAFSAFLCRSCRSVSLQRRQGKSSGQQAVGHDMRRRTWCDRVGYWQCSFSPSFLLFLIFDAHAHAHAHAPCKKLLTNRRSEENTHVSQKYYYYGKRMLPRMATGQGRHAKEESRLPFHSLPWLLPPRAPLRRIYCKGERASYLLGGKGRKGKLRTGKSRSKKEVQVRSCAE